ncbi:MAG: DUF4232 domain-containing protein [Solirubrobacteraceae bacterium]
MYLRLTRLRARLGAISTAGVLGTVALVGVASAGGRLSVGKQASVAMCASSALRLSLLAPITPQTGEHGREFALTNRSAHECQLFGYPRLAFYRALHRLAFQVQDGGHYVSARRPEPVVLAPGGHAYFLAAKYRCDGRVAYQATIIHVTLARHRQSLTADPGAGDFAYCRRYPGDARVDPGNRIDVSSIVATRSAAFAAVKTGTEGGAARATTSSNKLVSDVAKTSSRYAVTAGSVCAASQLAGSAGSPSPGAGSDGVTFRFRNVSAT